MVRCFRGLPAGPFYIDLFAQNGASFRQRRSLNCTSPILFPRGTSPSADILWFENAINIGVRKPFFLFFYFLCISLAICIMRFRCIWTIYDVSVTIVFIFFCYLPLLFTVKPETIKTSQRRIGLFSVMAFVAVPADIVHCNQRFFVQLSMTRYSMIMHHVNIFWWLPIDVLALRSTQTLHRSTQTLWTSFLGVCRFVFV